MDFKREILRLRLRLTAFPPRGSQDYSVILRSNAPKNPRLSKKDMRGGDPSAAPQDDSIKGAPLISQPSVDSFPPKGKPRLLCHSEEQRSEESPHFRCLYRDENEGASFSKIFFK